MEIYYVNTQAQENGDHEVHRSDCKFLPELENRQLLGLINNCHEALDRAKNDYPKSNGCIHCCPECHTT